MSRPRMVIAALGLKTIQARNQTKRLKERTMAVSIKFLFCLVLCSLVCLPALAREKHGHHHNHNHHHEQEEHSHSRSRSHPRGAEDPTDPLSGVVNSVNEAVSNIDNVADKVHEAENTIVGFFNNTKSTFEQAMANLSSYLPINVDYALNKSLECDPIKNNRAYYHTIALILSAVLIVLGLIFAFVGYRLMKIVLFLIGFLAAGSVTYFIILAFTHQISATWVLYVSIIVPVLVGIVAGIIVICLYYIGIFLAGGSIGFLIVWFILAAIDIAFFRTHIYVPIIIAVVVGIAVGIVTLFVQKWFFIFGTAVLGSFMIVWGLDYYIELGSIVYYLVLFAEHRSQITPCWYSWTMVAAFGLLILGGFLVQALLTGRKYDHKKEMKGMCCGLCSRKKKTKTTNDGGGKYMDLKEMNE